MNIPDKAVEAAALALDEYWGGRYAPNAVEELSDEMRVVLEAAAPFIAAQALRDAAERVGNEIDAVSEAIPALEDWADELDEK